MTQIIYTVVLLSEGKEGYTAVVPALPGCVTCDDTAEEALSMTKEVIELYIESELEHGEPIILEHSSGPHHQDSGEAKIRESTAGVSRKPSSDCKACGCSSKHLCGLTAWNT